MSEGCEKCYAERMDERFSHDRRPHCVPEKLREPLRRRIPSRYFCVSAGDLFHDAIPFGYVEQVFDVVQEAQRHSFIVLTKRPERALEFARQSARGFQIENLWIGVSVEDQRRADERVSVLNQIPACHRMVSVEPQLGPVSLVPWLPSLDWVVLGREYVGGRHGRPWDVQWAVDVQTECAGAGVAFLCMENFPAVREFPRGMA